MSIMAHPIPGRITRHDIEKVKSSINVAPTYSDRDANAIRCVIETIHELQALHTNLLAKEIEVYIGKVNRSATAVLTRWISHRQDHKKHMFGVILFKCSLNNAKKYERVGIRILQSLKNRDELCVGQANISGGSGGRNPESDEAVTYLTWCPLETPTAFQKPTIESLREVAHEVAPGLEASISEAQILNGLRAVKSANRLRKLKLNYY